jgi:hypothetical protein
VAPQVFFQGVAILKEQERHLKLLSNLVQRTAIEVASEQYDWHATKQGEEGGTSTISGMILETDDVYTYLIVKLVQRTAIEVASEHYDRRPTQQGEEGGTSVMYMM